MDSSRTVDRNASKEVNLKDFFKNIFRHKFLFLISLLTCLSLAYLYTQLATPIYQAGTSILIDASGNNRSLGESQYGKLSLIEMEKNIFNEMGVLKSFALVKQTLEELDYGVTYESGEWYKMEESDGYFPFEVNLLDSSMQVYNTSFEVKLLSDEKYELKIESEDFYISNPVSSGTRKVDKPIKFSKIYTFGEEVQHEYFNFVLNKPSYEVIAEDFTDKLLHFKLNDVDDLTNTYLDKLHVSQADIQASILELRTEGTIIQKEIDFLDKLTNNYFFLNLNRRNEIAMNKENFIRGQLNSISDSLSRTEAVMERFKRGTGAAVDFDRAVANNMDKKNELEADLYKVESQIKYYKQLLAYISDKSKINKILAPSAAGINDPLLNENILELKKLYSERTKKKFYKGEKSYDLVILDEQIENTTLALEENVRNLIDVSQLAFRNKQTRMAKIDSAIKKLPRSETQLGAHKRNSDAYETVYNYLNQELVKTGIARAENIATSRVLDAPRMIGDGPISPQTKLIYLLGGLLGLLLPMGWLVVFNSFDDKIRGLDQLEHTAPLPVAAGIAHLSSKSMFRRSTSWQVEESFRDLSANLQFLIKDPSKNVIGVTSIISSEGKTFCATNLAISLATAGKRVLLVDTDFRNPSVLRELAGAKRGLMQYLQGKIELAEQIIHKYPEVTNLDFIPTQAFTENPHELLSNPRLDILLGELRHHYDYIVLDTPAVGLVSDYLLISNNIDINLFVFRHNVSKTEYLDDMMKLKEKGNMKDAFIVYNDVPSNAFKHGHAYYQSKNKNFKSYVTRMFSL